jgi:hypothetical protein
VILRSTFDKPASGSDLFSSHDLLSLLRGTAILLNFKTSLIYYPEDIRLFILWLYFFSFPENKSMKRQNGITSPFKIFIQKEVPMLENLLEYYRKSEFQYISLFLVATPPKNSYSSKEKLQPSP